MRVDRRADGRRRFWRDRLEIVRIGHIGADRLDHVFARDGLAVVAVPLRRHRRGRWGSIEPAARAVRIVEAVVDALELVREALGRDLARDLVDDVPELVGVDPLGLVRPHAGAQLYAGWYQSTTIQRQQRRPAESGLMRRYGLGGVASCCSREVVEFCWREGLVLRTRRPSPDDVSGRERAPFDVVGKSSAGIRRCSIWVIRFERTKRLWQRIIYHRGLGS